MPFSDILQDVQFFLVKTVLVIKIVGHADGVPFFARTRLEFQQNALMLSAAIYFVRADINANAVEQILERFRG